MNETIVVEDGHAAVATVAVSGTLMPESSATDIITTVQTNNGKQAAVKVYNLNGGGEVGGDYLPLSGGTLTGDLGLSGENALVFDEKYAFKCGDAGEVAFGDVSAGFFNKKIIFSVTGYGSLNPVSNLQTLGTSGKKWGLVYAEKLNNGADIAVPTTGGTMALKEDIDAAVGNISTALTAILGE